MEFGGQPPIKLKKAIIKGNLIELAQLINTGYDVNAIIDNSGVANDYTALHVAADCGNKEAVQLLLENGADFTMEDEYNRTALHFACKKLDKDIIALIVKAYLTVCSKLNKNVERVFAERKIPTDLNIAIRHKFWTNFKPLHFAVKFHLIEILMILIECKVDIRKTDSNGITALHCLIHEFSGFIEDQMRDCRKVLLRVVKRFVQDRYCASSLDRIFTELIRMFVCSDENIKNSVDNFGRTPMFYLYVGLHYRDGFYYQLTEHGDGKWRFNITMQGWERVNMVRRLLRWPSVDMRLKDYEGNTILHALALVVFPCRHDDTLEEINFVIKEYLAAGGDIDATNNAGFTPLQFNCHVHNSEVAEALLRHGADINAMHPGGDTAYSIVRYVPLERSRQRWDIHSLIMFSFLKRMVILGAPVCDFNMNIYKKDNLELETDRDLVEIRKRIVFPEETYREELNRMKSEKIDEFTTMYNIVWKDVRDLVHHAKNPKLFDSNFFKNYPLYGYLVRNKMVKAKARADLLKPTRDILSWIVNDTLPVSCLNKILSNFKNNDLKDLKKVAEFNEIKKDD